VKYLGNLIGANEMSVEIAQILASLGSAAIGGFIGAGGALIAVSRANKLERKRVFDLKERENREVRGALLDELKHNLSWLKKKEDILIERFKLMLSGQMQFSKFPKFAKAVYDSSQEQLFHLFEGNVSTANNVRSCYDLMEIIDEHFYNYEDVYSNLENQLLEHLKFDEKMMTIRPETKDISDSERINKCIELVESKRLQYLSTYLGNILWYSNASIVTVKVILEDGGKIDNIEDEINKRWKITKENLKNHIEVVCENANEVQANLIQNNIKI